MRWRRTAAGPSIGGHETIRAMHRSAPALGIVAHGERPERHLANAAIQARRQRLRRPHRRPRAAAQRRRRRGAQESFVDPDVPPKGSRGKLTRRQREILQLLANGESTTVAARELGLTEETVKTHTKNTLARLGARNRTHAVAIALREP